MTKKTFTDALSSVLAGADPIVTADALTPETQDNDGGQISTKPEEPKAPKIGAVIGEMVLDATLSYDMIVNAIHARFPGCNTSARSVASVAARMRKTGVEVPMRRKGQAVA